jgi:micrococcal nuclease
MRKRAISAGSVLLLALLVWLLAEGPRESEDESGDGTAAPLTRPARAEVLRVVDGDTIEVELDGEEEDVRYIGVDTPETVKPGAPVGCFGPEASERNHELVEGRVVRLVFDRELRDDYGRLLAYVYADGRLVNAELVAGGYARTLEIEPNTSRAPQLARLEERASVAGRGLWSAC